MDNPLRKGLRFGHGVRLATPGGAGLTFGRRTAHPRGRRPLPGRLGMARLARL